MICEYCGNATSLKNALGKPKCTKCFLLAQHEWNYMNPTYDYFEHEQNFAHHREQIKRWFAQKRKQK